MEWLGSKPEDSQETVCFLLSVATDETLVLL